MKRHRNKLVVKFTPEQKAKALARCAAVMREECPEITVQAPEP